MLRLLLSLMLQEEPPEIVPVPATFEPHAHALLDVRVGVGALYLGGFEAETMLGRREIDSDALAAASIELGVDWEGWGLHLGGAAAGAGDVQARLGWLRLSSPALLEFGDPLPMALRLSAGPVAGTVDVDEAGFGDFEPSVGFLSRVTVETPRTSPLVLGLWADAIVLEFDYDEGTITGDESLGGLGVAFGLSAGLRF